MSNVVYQKSRICLLLCCGDSVAFVARFASYSGLFSECHEAESPTKCIGNQLVYRYVLHVRQMPRTLSLSCVCLFFASSMSFSICCFFLMTGCLSYLLARGYQNCCCLTFVQIPMYFALLVVSLFLPIGPLALFFSRDHPWKTMF